MNQLANKHLPGEDFMFVLLMTLLDSYFQGQWYWPSHFLIAGGLKGEASPEHLCTVPVVSIPGEDPSDSSWTHRCPASGKGAVGTWKCSQGNLL